MPIRLSRAYGPPDYSTLWSPALTFKWPRCKVWFPREWAASWSITPMRSTTSSLNFASSLTSSLCAAIQARWFHSWKSLNDGPASTYMLNKFLECKWLSCVQPPDEYWFHEDRSRLTAETSRNLMTAWELWGRPASRFGHLPMSWRRWAPRMLFARSAAAKSNFKQERVVKCCDIALCKVCCCLVHWCSGCNYEHWFGGHIGVLLSWRVCRWFQKNYGIPAARHQAKSRLFWRGHLDYQAQRGVSWLVINPCRVLGKRPVHDPMVQHDHFESACFFACVNRALEPSKLRNYCKEYGERICEDGEKLMLMEANDNHEEERVGGCGHHGSSILRKFVCVLSLAIHSFSFLPFLPFLPFLRFLPFLPFFPSIFSFCLSFFLAFSFLSVFLSFLPFSLSFLACQASAFCVFSLLLLFLPSSPDARPLFFICKTKAQKQGSPSHLAGFLHFLRKIAPKRELPFEKVATKLVALQMIHCVSVVQSSV